MKKISPFNNLFWINKGFSKEESILKSKEHKEKLISSRKHNKQQKIQKLCNILLNQNIDYDTSIKLAIEQIKNETTPSKIEYWLKREYSLGEAIINKEKYLDKTIPSRINFWIIRGFSKEESILKVKDVQIKNLNKRIQKGYKKEDCNTTIEYYLKKGFTEEEAKEKLSERQRTFTLEKCIIKYGEIEGRKKWKERQEKWQNTLNSKPQEEKNDINKRKIVTYERMIHKYGKEKADKWLKSKICFKKGNKSFSKMSFDLFNIIQEKLNRKFYYGPEEKIFNTGKNAYVVDFYDPLTNKIIEFYGSMWHADPRFYKETDKPIFNKGLTSKEIWELNIVRINNLKNYIKDLLIIWEYDYCKNKDDVINKIIIFLNNE